MPRKEVTVREFLEDAVTRLEVVEEQVRTVKRWIKAVLKKIPP